MHDWRPIIAKSHLFELSQCRRTHHLTLMRFGLIALCLALSSVAGRADPIQFDRLGVEDGLSQATVTSIVQDATGFMWFGTQDGLNRYDGHRFVVYTGDPQDPHSLPHSSIFALAASPDGDVWIGTDAGLARWHRNTGSFSSYHHDPNNSQSLSANDIRVLLRDQNESLWVGTESGGLNRLDEATQSFHRYRHRADQEDGLPDNAIQALHEDPSGRLWVGTRKGLAYYDADRDLLLSFDLGDPQRSLGPNPWVRSLAEGFDGQLWVGTVDGLQVLSQNHSTPLTLPKVTSPSDKLDARTLTTIETLHNDLIRTMLRDHRQRLWIGTDAGLIHFRGDEIQRLRNQPNQPKSLNGDRITAIYQDRNEVIWIANQGGISKLRDSSFIHIGKTLGKDTGLSSNLVLPFSQGSDGQLWIGTLGGGLNRMDRETGSFRYYREEPNDPTSLSDDRVTALLHDNQDNLWVGTMHGGLCRLLSNETFQCFLNDPAISSSLSNNGVTTIYQDHLDNLWVGTRDGVVNKLLNNDGRFQRFTRPSTAPKNTSLKRITAIEETNSRWLWIGTLGDGLSRLDRTEHVFRRFHQPLETTSGINSDDVTSLLYDELRDTLWVGTKGSGLNRLKGPNKETGPTASSNFDSTHGLPNESINGLALDLRGGLWLSTDRGLSKFDITEEIFTNFDTSHGLQSLDFTMGSVYQSPSGEIFFGGHNGFNIVRPELFEQESRIPPVLLTAFSKFNREVTFDRSIFTLDHIDLQYRDRFLTFEVAVLDYAVLHKNIFRYRLAGFDDRWVDLGNDHAIHLNGLDPGSYTLRVQAANSNGVWNRQGIHLGLQVHPPWWRTRFAYGVYAIFLVLSSIGVVRWQQNRIAQERVIHRQLLELDHLKDDFLANTSHELRTPLHGMTGLAESLLHGHAGELTESAKEHLDMIVVCGQRLGGLVDDILDFARLKHEARDNRLGIDKKPVHLRPLVQLAFALTKPMLDDKPIEMINRLPLGLPPTYADENRVKQVLINLIGNAIKFTDEGSIVVSATVKEDRLTLKIQDTGIGVPASKLEQIFEPFEQADASSTRRYQGTGLGLAISRRLVHLMDGKIWVDSKLGQGSTFYFELPKSIELTPSSETESKESFLLISNDIDTLRRETKAQRSAAEPNVEPHGEGAKILVVDDDSVNRKVLRNYLAVGHHGLTFAKTGEAALQFLSDQSFDLVLLDVMMPQMSGYEVCRILRSEHSIEELPVIFLTAKGQEADIMQGLDAGANDYLTKPISREELLSRIRPHLALVKIYRQLEARVEDKIAQIRILRGLLPICAQCKKIRNDKDGGEWEDFERYLDENSEAQLSHSVCPECVATLYPELDL